MSALFPSTDEDALAELRREQKVRDECFPRWVESGKLEPEDADRRQADLAKAIEIVEAYIARRTR